MGLLGFLLISKTEFTPFFLLHRIVSHQNCSYPQQIYRNVHKFVTSLTFDSSQLKISEKKSITTLSELSVVHPWCQALRNLSFPENSPQRRRDQVLWRHSDHLVRQLKLLPVLTLNLSESSSPRQRAQVCLIGCTRHSVEWSSSATSDECRSAISQSAR